MKKLLILTLTSLFVCCTNAPVAQETAVAIDDLPAPAQQFIKQHFDSVQVKKVIREQRASLMQYEVDLKGGIDLQFDRNGVCTEVSSKKDPIPTAVMPEAIQQQLEARFPGMGVIKYEHDSRLYDINLADGTEVTFNRAMRLIDVDK